MADNIKCPNCGVEISMVKGSPAQFCVNCGTKIVYQEPVSNQAPKTEKTVTNVERVKQLEKEANLAKSKRYEADSDEKKPKDKKKTLIIIGVIILAFIIISLISNGSKNKKREDTVQSGASVYKLYIDVTYNENLFLNKYDVDVYLDDKEIGSIKQGETLTHLSEVTSGEHEIRFSKSDDDTVDGSKTIDVNNDMTFSCKITSSSSSISITDAEVTDSVEGSQMEVPELRGMNLKEALDNLKKTGFVNVVSEPQEDASIFDESGWVIVAQNKAPGTTIDKNDRFIVSSIKKDHFDSSYVKDEATGNYYKPVDFKCGGIDFRYPSYYSVEDNSKGVAKYTYPKESDYHATLSFNMNPYASIVEDSANLPTTLEKIMKKDLSIDTEKSMTVMSSKEITVAGLPAWRMDISMGDDITGKSTFIALLIANPEKNAIVYVYLGHDTDDPSNYRYGEDFDEMIKNAQIDETFEGVAAQVQETKPEAIEEEPMETGEKETIAKEPDVYTVENNEDLANLFALEAVNPEEQQKFVKKYLGKKIEFDAIIYNFIPNPDYSTIASYVVVPGKDINSPKCALFYLEDLNYSGFQWDTSKKMPEILLPGTLLRLQGEVKKGADTTYIYLKPTKTYAR